MEVTYNNISKDIEDAVIGAILIDGDAITSVGDILSEECFTDQDNRKIFIAARALYADGKGIDIATVATRLKGDVDVSAIIAKTGVVSTSLHLETHAVVLSELLTKRKLQEFALNLYATTARNDKSADEVLEEADALLRKVAESVPSFSPTTKLIKEFVDEALKGITKRQQNRINGVPVCGITSGLYNLDGMIGGWKGGELVVLGGRPGMGKTALMLSFARAAARQGSNVVLFSLEMNGVTLADRNLIGVSDVSPESYHRGELTDAELSRISDASYDISGLPIFIEEKCRVSMDHIFRKCRKMKRAGVCDIVMIDYLQLINTERMNGRNRENEVAQLSRTAKLMAMELDITVLLLSQLSRSCEERADKMPELKDLRESGAIEQDADKVLFAFRQSYYKKNNEPGFESMEDNVGMILVRKNRNGSCGNVRFRHNSSMTNIYDY